DVPARVLAEARDPHEIARVRRLDEQPPADVHPFVPGYAECARVEEDEIAWLQRLRRDGRAFVDLEARVVGEVNPELRVDVHGQARAVEAADRARAAPAIRHAEILRCDCRRAAADS